MTEGVRGMSVGVADRLRKGFTLLEVMVATIILSLGLVALLTAFMQCQRIMRATQGFETADIPSGATVIVPGLVSLNISSQPYMA